MGITRYKRRENALSRSLLFANDIYTGAGIHLIQQSKSDFDTRSRYEASRELCPPLGQSFSSLLSLAHASL